MCKSDAERFPDAGGAAGDEGRHAGLQLHLAGAVRADRPASGERERHGAGRGGYGERGRPAELPRRELSAGGDRVVPSASFLRLICLGGESDPIGEMTARLRDR